ncbi:MAG: MvdC/MvdD family ATP grasp protein [Nitrospirota bacterium]
MILIISHPDDIHATEVMRHLGDMGQEAKMLDLAEFPMNLSLSISYDHKAMPSATVRNKTDLFVDLAKVKSTWWRRPQAYSLPQMKDNEAFTFTYNEWDEAISGLWQLVPGIWINEPNRDIRASRKAFQLGEATAVGLRIPRTLITSDPIQARRFIGELGVERTVYKSFSATEHTWRETRVLRKNELDLLDHLRLAPVIFQEYIPAEVDLRITVVGSQIFAAAIHSQEGDYKADFRMDMGRSRITPAVLPREIERLLLALMERLGLVYGAIDVRRTPDGEYVFLEVNTAGQWLFIEEKTKQPIARTLAETLARV